MEMQRFSGKAVLITGGASGIGAATAQAFVREGARVAILDQKAEADMSHHIRAPGSDVHYLRANLSVEADICETVNRAIALLGCLDGLFSNAGVLVLGESTEFAVEDYDRVFGTNVRGLFVLLRETIPELRKVNGSVVATSSVAGLRGFAGNGLYAASKHAVEAIIKSAALENARYGVQMSTINPGVVETAMFDDFAPPQSDERRSIIEQHPLGRAGTPDEIAQAILFLASYESRYITGVSLPVDGGFLLQ